MGCFLEDPEILYAPDHVDYYCRVCRKGYLAFFLRGVRAYHQLYLDKTVYRVSDGSKPACWEVRQFGDPRCPPLPLW